MDEEQTEITDEIRERMTTNAASLPGLQSHQRHPDHDMVLTTAQRACLNDWQERTGIGPVRLLSARGDVPLGLNANMVYRWMVGITRRVYSGYYDYVLTAYAEATPLKRLTPADRDLLHAHKERAGSWGALLVRLSPHPDYITADLLVSWAAGKASTVPQDLWDFVSERLCRDDEEIKSARHGQTRSGYVQIPRQTIIDMKKRMRALRRGSISLLKGRSDIPEGLKPGTIDRWFNRPNPAARRDHLHYFQKVLHEAPPKRDLPRRKSAPNKSTLAARLGMHHPDK